MAEARTAPLRELTPRLGPEVAAILLDGAAGIPPAVAKEVAQAAKDVSFTRAASMSLVGEAATRLAVYGRLDHAVRLALAMVPVPFTGNVDLYEPVRTTARVASVFSERAGDLAGVSALAPYLSSADGSTINPTRVEGRLLRFPIDHPQRWADLGPKYLASALLADVAELAAMRHFALPKAPLLSRSKSWTIRRVDAQLEVTLAALDGVPGYERRAHPSAG